MKLRELKEAAHALFARGRYAQCAETYERILRLAPKDPNVRVRHAESCRRAGDRQSAITSYRAASTLLMEQGCESRARGALRAALELDPRDPMILADLARLGQQASPVNALEDERHHSSGAAGFFERPGTASAKGSATPRAPQGQLSPPPPPPPAYVLRAAEETPAPGPLPAVPNIAPLNANALRATGRTMVPLRASGVVPSITPVIQGRLITQAPVPPAARAAGPGEGAAARPAAVPPAPRPSRPSGATMVPLPRAGATPGVGGDARAAAPAAMPYRPELRRLGPNAVALRVSPQARWVIIRSDSPLELSRAESLPASGEQQAGAAYAPEARPVSPASANH